MSSRPVHNQFTQFRRPTAKCEGCNEKAHKVLNRCHDCIQQYCNTCLDAGVGNHQRSAKNPSRTAAGDEQLAPYATPAWKKRKLDISTSLNQTTGQNSDESPTKFATPKTMGTFHPSPQHLQLNGANSGKPVGPPLKHGHLGLSTTEFDDILNNPWNKRSTLDSHAPGSKSSNSDMESDGDIDKHHMNVSNVPDSLKIDPWKAATSKVYMGTNSHRTVQQGPNIVQSKDQDSFVDNHVPVQKSRAAVVAQRLRSVFGTKKVKKVVKKVTWAKPQATKAKRASSKLTLKSASAGPSKISSVSEIDLEETLNDDDPDANPVPLAELHLDGSAITDSRKATLSDLEPASEGTLSDEVPQGYYWLPTGNEAPSQYPHTIHADPRTRVRAAEFSDVLVHEQVTPKVRPDSAVPTYASEQTKGLFAIGSRYRHDSANLDLLVLASAQLK